MEVKREPCKLAGSLSLALSLSRSLLLLLSSVLITIEQAFVVIHLIAIIGINYLNHHLTGICWNLVSMLLQSDHQQCLPTHAGLLFYTFPLHVYICTLLLPILWSCKSKLPISIPHMESADGQSGLGRIQAGPKLPKRSIGLCLKFKF